jgi:hypothetical protein
MPGKWSLCFGLFGAVLMVALPVFWLVDLPSPQSGRFVCTTPSIAMSQAIDERMRDARVLVSHVRVMAAHDGRYEVLFLVSAQVRASGIFVGFGTWATNFRDLHAPGHRFGGWSREPAADPLVPVNDLALALSSGVGSLRSPGMTTAARNVQSCAGWKPHA